MALRRTFAKVGAAAVTVGVAALVTMWAGPAFGQAAPPSGTTVAPPNPVPTVAVFGGPSDAYQGDAGELTITIPANSTFPSGTDLTWEQCSNDPTSQSNCDGLTLQESNVGSSLPVAASSTGAVTITYDFYILPTGTTPDAATYGQGFDPDSTITCNATTPCAVWIGPDTSNWTSDSMVIDGIEATPAAAPTTTTTAPTTSTTAPTTSTTAPTTSTTAPTTSTTAPTTSTTSPTQGQVPESPYVPLLPLGAGAVVGGGFLAYLAHRRRTTHP